MNAAQTLRNLVALFDQRIEDKKMWKLAAGGAALTLQTRAQSSTRFR
jgi:hypothetical protein